MGDEINNAPPPEGETSGDGDSKTTPSSSTPPPTQPPPTEPKPTAADDRISKANAAAARMEAANTKFEELLAKQEAMQVEKTLGGETDAGAAKKEETPVEYKDRIMKGEIGTPR